MIAAIIQARMGASRLPGKVLMKVLGKPLLSYQADRIKAAKVFDKVIVATTVIPEDDIIQDWCANNEVLCFRGSSEDVLDRYYKTALFYDMQPHDSIARLTADCPLIDPRVIRDGVNTYKQNTCDYLSNTNPPTYPDGFDIEVFSFAALTKAWHLAVLPSEREHVTPYIRNHPEIFSLAGFQNDVDLSYLRLTIDEIEDFMLIERIIAALYPDKPRFDLLDILELLKNNPDWLNLNQQYQRNEGYIKSLAIDKEAGMQND